MTDTTQAGSVEIQGHVEPGYEPVLDAFAANFADHDEVGAACSIYVKGRAVVDIWGGLANTKDVRPWTRDTSAVVFSTTKGMTAICALMLAERGELDLAAAVSEYWPDFAAEGKGEIPVEHLLTHRSGLPAIDVDLTPEQAFAWDPVVEALAAQRPYWEPGSRHGYHAMTYGWLVGEVIRRISGRSVGTFLAEEVAGPLGLEVWIGLPEEHQDEVSRLTGAPLPTSVPDESVDLPPGARESAAAFQDPRSLTYRAFWFIQPPLKYNHPATRAAEMPAANGVATARGLARMYAATVGEVDGIRLLRPETVDDARRPRSEGPDAVNFRPSRFGLGFALPTDLSPMAGPSCFGHPGAGGSLAFADPERELAFGYVMNFQTNNPWGDPRTLGLLDALARSG